MQDDVCTGVTECSGFDDLEYVHAEPGLILASAIGSFDGRCAVDHYGAADRCTGEPAYKTTIWYQNESQFIALCPKHAGETNDPSATGGDRDV